MKRFFATFVAFAFGVPIATAEIPDTYAPSAPLTNAPASVETTHVPVAALAPATKPASAKPKTAHSSVPTSQSLAQMQSSLDQLTKSNHELLDLLKQQQAVLEDIQYDRRLQSRQIDSLEQRLEEALDEKQQLQRKVDSLETQASQQNNPAPVTGTAPAYKESDVQAVPQSGTTRGKGFVPPDATPSTASNGQPPMPTIETVKTPDATAPPGDAPAPPPPASYLPPEGADNPPGQKWHRVLSLKGTDNQQTDVFTIHGKAWRVLWHNQDKSGKLYANTSALFINAFPRDDTIPSQVCSKLGTGGDAANMQGAGNYYLKIEASGGSWEIAVEDLQ